MKTTRRSLLGMILAAAASPVLAKVSDAKPLTLGDIRPVGEKIRGHGVSGSFGGDATAELNKLIRETGQRMSNSAVQEFISMDENLKAYAASYRTQFDRADFVEVFFPTFVITPDMLN